MRPDRASRTAEHNALFRALETARPTGERPMVDPLARTFVTWPLSVVAHLGALPGLGAGVRAVIDRRWPGVRTSVVARTRLIDDGLEALVAAGATQVVLLGAGYDSRPYRLAPLHHLTVFEVDHPSTQAVKKEVLRRVLPVPPNVRFVPTDFNLDELRVTMAAAGFAADERTTFVWEGVTNYLDDGAVDRTMRWFAASAPGSSVLFTYVDRAVLTHPARYHGTEQLFATLARAGEDLTFGIEPDHLGPYLEQRGLRLEFDIGAAEYRRRYFGSRAHRMVGHEFYRVARASIDAGASGAGVATTPTGARSGGPTG